MKRGEPRTLTMEAWRPKMDPWRFCRPVIADLNHLDEEQDPDPHWDRLTRWIWLLMTCLVSFRPKQRTWPFYKFVRCSNDFILQKLYFSRLMRVSVGLIMVSCLFLSFLLITSGV